MVYITHKDFWKSISDILIERRRSFALFFLALFFATLPGLLSLSFEQHYKVFADENNEYLKELNQIEATYQAREDSMIFLVEAPEGETLMEPTGLSLIAQLTRDALTMDYAFDSESLSNYQIIEADNDFLTAHDLIPADGVKSPEEAAKIKKITLNEPALVRRMISEDGTLAAILVTFALPKERAKALDTMQEQASALRSKYNENFPKYRVYMSGLLFFDIALTEATIKDSKLIVPLTGLFVFLVLLAIFRSVACAGFTVLTVVINVVATYGLVGYWGYAVNILTFSGMTIIATLSVADSTHLLISFLINVRAGQKPVTAMCNAMRFNLFPMFLTSLTTFVGFLALILSPSPPVQQLGLFTAVGVSFDWITTVFLLPAMVLTFSNYRGLSESTSSFSSRLAHFSVQRPIRKLLFGTIGCLTVAMFTFTNDLNDNAMKWLDQKIEFRRSIDVTEGRLDNFKTLTFNLQGNGENSVLEPKFMRNVENFTTWLHQQPEVQYVYTYLDALKDGRRAFNDGNDEYYSLPNTREEAAQILLLRELSVPSSRSLNSMLNIEKSETRILLALRNIENKQYLAFEKRARNWLLDHDPGIVRQGTSIPLMFAQTNQDNLRSMIYGSILVVIIVSICIGFAVGSIFYGILALIPNILPILLTYGLWGIFYGTLDMAAIITFSLSLGIVVDDTIHVLTKYKTRLEHNEDPITAMTTTLEKTASALITTSLVLGGCFLLQSLSHFQLNATQGIMVFITIFFALILDLFYLPSLLLISAQHIGIRRLSSRATAKIGAILILSLVTLAIPTDLRADAGSQAKGKAIVEAADARHAGYVTMKSDGTMTLFDGSGHKTVRRFGSIIKEGRRGAHTSRMDFLHPKDVEGTQLLTQGLPSGDNRQWIYLPSFHKVRRIAGGNSRNSFLGSEFSYEDLTSSSIDKYTYDYLDTKPCPNDSRAACDLVERTPKNRNDSAYSKSVLWISQDKLLTERVDYYASNGQNIKTFHTSKFTLVDGRFWQIAISMMKNNLSGRRTQMQWAGHKSQVSVAAETFDPRRLGE